ncbi:hypothetical protein [Streptomyces sp. NBC_01089]|nr:hypothetical protein OG510_32495 [Streptomyces sp. NBC_01089]
MNPRQDIPTAPGARAGTPRAPESRRPGPGEQRRTTPTEEQQL